MGGKRQRHLHSQELNANGFFELECIMGKTLRNPRRGAHANNENFMILIASVVSGNTSRVREIVDASPELVQMPAMGGASRENA